MPGLQNPSILEEVRRTCQQAYEAQNHVSISTTALEEVARKLSQQAVKSLGGTTFPVKFDSLEAEVSFLAMYHLLDFGSGFNPLLQAANRRSAKETIQFGALGLHLTADRLDTKWMEGFSGYHVHNAFGVEANVEQELQPGITISRPGPLAPFVRALQQMVNQTGKDLEAVGAKSLGAFILETLKEQRGTPSAAHLVQQLSEHITGFQDQGLFVPEQPAAPGTAVPTGHAPLECSTSSTASAAASPSAATAAETAGAGDEAGTGAGQTAAGGAAAAGAPFEVMFLRKAQCLAADLMDRLGQQEERFKWADQQLLTADTSPCVASVLRSFGVLVCNSQLAKQVDEQQVLPAGNPERSIRAAIVVAVDRLAAAVEGGVSAMEVSRYLASLAEEGQEAHGQVAPHLCTATTAY